MTILRPDKPHVAAGVGAGCVLIADGHQHRAKLDRTNGNEIRMMTIRPYEPTDADAVWKLHNLALQGTGAHLGNGPWDNDLKSIPAVYLQAGGTFLVGVVGGRITRPRLSEGNPMTT